MGRRYLVVKLASLGDVLATTPLFRLLRESGPEVQVDHLVMEHCAAATAANPHVHRQILSPFFPTGHALQDLRTVWKLVRQLRRERYDAAFIFHRHWLFQVMARLAGIRQVHGFSATRNPFLATHVPFRFDMQRTLQETAVLRQAGIQFAAPERLEFSFDAAAVPRDLVSSLPERFIACNPGGGNPHSPATNRLWPWERYADLFSALPFPVVLVGRGASDAALGEQIMARTKAKVLNLIDRTGFEETAFVLQRAELFIGNDSALMFLASALATPALGLYGPTQIEAAQPLGPRTEGIRGQAHCAPCYNPYDGLGGRMYTCTDNICMQSIGVDQVRERIERMLAKHAADVTASASASASAADA
jgi:ADP-heptose:LPS heptosyltransferase